MEKIWLKEYPAAIPAEINLNAYTSAVDVLEKSMNQNRHMDAFECMGAKLSFGQLDTLTKNLASYLTNSLGLGKGDRVAIMLPNILQYPVAMFGILHAGMVVVNVNPLYTPRELEYQLRDSDAKAIVVLESLYEAHRKTLEELDLKGIVTTQVADMGRLATSGRDANESVKPSAPRGAIDLTAALAEGSAQAFAPVALTREDNAFLQYTGGTTGLSKGAQLSHGNVVANLMQLEAWMSVTTHAGNECFITMIPLYHIMGLTGSCLLSASLGSKNVLFPNPRDLDASIAELKKHRFTIMLGVNTLFNSLLNAPAFAEVDFSSLKITIGAGAAVQQVVADRWKALTGNDLTEAYGLTEASPAVTFAPLDKPDWNGTIGIPLPSTIVALRDENNRDVQPGQAGELCIKGPQVMRGYWNKPKETEDVFTADGYLKTGDIAVMDERGYFKLVDRKKDMILVSGFNVYPTEIEAVVAMHEGVLECACIGIPDHKSGEVPKVYIVRKDPALELTAIQSHCKKHLTGYKLPRHYEFRDQLPKSGVGKILRRELRDA